ncbi:MAG TPA: phosphopantetheine-binding protein [Bacillota bacterium]|nr:phosphopantetheine-binding protein [Bacillota bacterium]HUM56161.1 phosphopantetheine-binding protein [Bacillota bacterium]
MEKIIEILNDIKPNVDYSNEKKLVDDEILDSFEVVAIIGELSEAFGIEITVDEMIPENFNSAEAMEKLVKRLLEEQK